MHKQEIIDAVNSQNRKCVNISNQSIKTLGFMDSDLFRYDESEGNHYYNQMFNQSVDTNEMIDHIGDVNEMVDVPQQNDDVKGGELATFKDDVREDDVEYSLISNNYLKKEIEHLNQIRTQCEGTAKDKIDMVLFYFERLKEQLLPQQKENTYTEEQVREAFMKGVSITGEGYNAEYAGGNNPDLETEFGDAANEFIQSLKQHKQ